MKSVNISKVIQQRRTELGLTREQVCEGICSPMTLMRIEQGTNTPSKYILEALSQRLGLSLERFSYMLSEEDFELEALKKRAMDCSWQRKDAAFQRTSCTHDHGISMAKGSDNGASADSLG